MRHGMSLAALAAALLWSGPSFAVGAITAGEFLRRAEPLMKRNKATLVFSADARDLARSLGTAAQNTRTRLDADRAAGRKVATCLPPKGKASIQIDELLAHLRGLSPAQRGQSLEQALGAYMARKYPC